MGRQAWAEESQWVERTATNGPPSTSSVVMLTSLPLTPIIVQAPSKAEPEARPLVQVVDSEDDPRKNE